MKRVSLTERNVRRITNQKRREDGFRVDRTFRHLDRAMSRAREIRAAGHEAICLSFPRTSAHTVWVKEETK